MAIQIGDRVAWNSCGEGVVRCFHGSFAGIEFDNERTCYHSLSGRCEDGHGYYVPTLELRSVEPMNISTLPKKREW